MADYSHLKKLDVTEDSLAEFIFDDIPGEPSVWFRAAGDMNVEYINERVRLAAERAEAQAKESKGQRRKRILSVEQLEEDREQDRILMARTCAVKWGNPPKDAQGKTQEFSADEVLDFFRALPNYMFDPCRGFVSNVYNFVDQEARKALMPGGGEELGNS